MKKMRYPNRLKTLRKMRGLSQEDLASMVGTIKGQIYKLETGERKLTHPWMVRLAKPLECSPWELISADHAPAPTPQTGLNDGEKGLIHAMQGIILALFSKKILQEADLDGLFTYHLRDFRANGQPNAAEVMNQLLNFLHSSPSALPSQSSEKLPLPSQGQRQKETPSAN